MAKFETYFWEWLHNRPTNDHEAEKRMDEYKRILNTPPAEKREYNKDSILKLIPGVRVE